MPTVWAIAEIDSDTQRIKVKTFEATILYVGATVKLTGTGFCDDRWVVGEMLSVVEFILSDSGGFAETTIPYGVPLDKPTVTAEWLVTIRPIANASNTDPIIILVTDEHNLEPDDPITISGCEGNTAANVTEFIVTNIPDNYRVELSGIAGNGNYTGGGWLELL